MYKMLLHVKSGGFAFFFNCKPLWLQMYYHPRSCFCISNVNALPSFSVKYLGFRKALHSKIRWGSLPKLNVLTLIFYILLHKACALKCRYVDLYAQGLPFHIFVSAKTYSLSLTCTSKNMKSVRVSLSNTNSWLVSYSWQQISQGVMSAQASWSSKCWYIFPPNLAYPT